MRSDADAGATKSSTADGAVQTAITADVGHAVVQVACRAPSIHNTQPWLWEIGPDGLDLRADRTRQLAVADPDGHSLLISCGAALALTGMALQGVGLEYQVHRFPLADDPDLLARFIATGRAEPTEADKQRVDAAVVRHSDRRPFSPDPVPPEAVERLRSAASAEGVYAHFPMRADEQLDLAVAVSWADRVERDDQAYVAEMTRWLRDDEVHSPDGVPLGVIPKVDPAHPRHVDVPLRDFEIGASGRELIAQDVDEHPLIAVILSDSDSPTAQLQAGESMMRLMIEAHTLGVACCPLSQAVDLVAFRRRIQALMNWQGYPQMMLRLGYPTASAEPLITTPRRPISSVLKAAHTPHP